jgi:hypothetical protein
MAQYELLTRFGLVHCESFGCMGVGLFIFVLALVVFPVCAGLLNGLICKNWRTGLRMLSFVLLSNVIGLSVGVILQQRKIADDVAAAAMSEVQFYQMVDENKKRAASTGVQPQH